MQTNLSCIAELFNDNNIEKMKLSTSLINIRNI